jgi:hypothetical protein
MACVRVLKRDVSLDVMVDNDKLWVNALNAVLIPDTSVFDVMDWVNALKTFLIPVTSVFDVMDWVRVLKREVSLDVMFDNDRL